MAPLPPRPQAARKCSSYVRLESIGRGTGGSNRYFNLAAAVPPARGNTALQLAFLCRPVKRREAFMNDFRDIQHGVNDPVDAVDVKRRFNDNQTPHERAQRAADVRSSAIPATDEQFLPEAL